MFIGFLNSLFWDSKIMKRDLSTKFALLGDIGGTNTRLQLVCFKKHSCEPEEILYKVFPS
jgi:hypothetical protein